MRPNRTLLTGENGVAESLLLDTWYRRRHRWLSVLLLPLSWFFAALTHLRRVFLQRAARAHRLPLPVIVIGNITLGGSGKSPLLIAVAKRLKEAGYAPGVVSRGYGSDAPHYPFFVMPDASAREAGDEPLMIARASGCPVVIDRDRLAAARALVESKRCNLILSDDGLQHYRLPRDLEIVVVDGQRLLGNGRLLPAGPLREGARRLSEVDWVLVNGGEAGQGRFPQALAMNLQPLGWQPLGPGQEHPLEPLPWKNESRRVHAVAGIGNPERFFTTLHQLGLDVIPHAFADHWQYRACDLRFDDGLSVVMTEKDAVKCRELLNDLDGEYWYLRVGAQVEEVFYTGLLQQIDSIRGVRPQTKADL